MADQSVRVTNPEGGKHRVAYDMALMMWHRTNDFTDPSIDDASQFLDLVKDCMRTLNESGLR